MAADTWYDYDLSGVLVATDVVRPAANVAAQVLNLDGSPVSVRQNDVAVTTIQLDATGSARFQVLGALAVLVDAGSGRFARMAQQAYTAAQEATDAAAEAVGTANTAAQIASGIADTAQQALDTAHASEASVADALVRVDGFGTQIDNLLDNSAAITELVQSGILPTLQSGATPQSQLSSNSSVTIWVAPFPCKITWATLSWDYWTLAQNATNYWTFNLMKLVGGAGQIFVSKSTSTGASGQAVAPRVPMTFAEQVWNTDNATLATGDPLLIYYVKTGTPASIQLPLTFTFRYQPL